MSEETIKQERRGYTTTEFWLTAFANIVSLIFMSGALDTTVTEWDNRFFGIVAMVLVNMGYSVSRGLTKKKA